MSGGMPTTMYSDTQVRLSAVSVSCQAASPCNDLDSLDAICGAFTGDRCLASPFHSSPHLATESARSVYLVKAFDVV